MAGVRFGYQPRFAGRNELDYHIYQGVDRIFVPDDVNVTGCFEERRSGLAADNHVGRASWIVTLVKSRGPGLDDNQAGS